MGVTEAVVRCIKGITQNWLVQNVIGELAGDLVEKALGGVSDAIKDHKYAHAVRQKIDEFLSIDGAEVFLREAAQRCPQLPHKKWSRPFSDADIGKTLAEYVKSDPYTDPSVWKREIEGISASDIIKRYFRSLLVAIQDEAGKYWESMLDKPNAAVVYLVTRNVAKQNDAMFEKIEQSFSQYLFGANAPAPSLNLLRCENCGEALNPANGRKTESGLYAFVCPSCGTPHAGGSFSSDGVWAQWSSDLKDFQMQMRSDFEKTWSKLDDIRSEVHQNTNRLEQIEKTLSEMQSQNNRHENSEVEALLNAGDAARQKTDFDTAIECYQEALKLDPNSAAAYFGIALAEYKVLDLFVFDGKQMTIVPVCCDPKIYLSKTFYESQNYRNAYAAANRASRYGPSQQKDNFEQIANRIAATQEIFKAENKKGVNHKRNKQEYGFDVFFCVKVTETDDSGKKTQDREEALKLYKSLRKKYRIFYSESDEGKNFLKEGNRDPAGYNARLTYALYSAKCLLVICGNKAYLETDYVKNEYTLFSYMIKQGYKSKGSIQIYSTSQNPIVNTLPGIGPLQVIVSDTNNDKDNDKKPLKEIREFINQFIDEEQIVNPPQPPRPEPKPQPKPQPRPQPKPKPKPQPRPKPKPQPRPQPKPKPKPQPKPQPRPQPKPKPKPQPKPASEPAQMKDVDTFAMHVIAYSCLLILLTFLYQLLFHFAPLNSAPFALKLTADICGYVLGVLCLGFGILLSISEAAAKRIKTRLLAWMRIILSVVLGLTILGAGLIWLASINQTAPDSPGVVTPLPDDKPTPEPDDDPSLENPEPNPDDDPSLETPDDGPGSDEEPEPDDEPKPDPYPTLDDYDKTLFEIEGTVLKKYLGSRSVVKIPLGVTEIGDSAFASKYYTLSEVTIPEGVTSIGNSAFHSCYTLKQITIPNSMTSIGNYAFSDCSALQTIDIPVGVTEIGNYAFNNCRAATNITIPTSVKSIGNGAFSGCSALQTIDIPEGITEIGNYAFNNCRAATKITIPEGVKSIGNYAFSGCSALQTIDIPQGVKSIGGYAFSGCRLITNITIPASVVSIGQGAFGGCVALEKIEVDGDNQYYRSESNCLIEKETDILIAGCNQSVIPEGVTEIGAGAFRGCTMTTLSLPEWVTKIGSEAFYGCKSLTKIEAPGVTSIGGYAFYDCDLLVDISLPQVTSIGNRAFYDCNLLVDFSLPQVTSIGIYAFSYCDSLADVSLPQVTSIEYSAFYSCVALERITFPNLKQISFDVFSSCTSLEEITIPEGVTRIGSGTFSGCTALTTVNLPNVTSIDYDAFKGCSMLSGIEIPKVRSIGYSAFEGCTALAQITLPECLTSIGEGAFKDCTSLTEITIPAGVTTVGRDAFRGCNGLTIYCEAESEPQGWDVLWNFDDLPVVWDSKKTV